MIKIFRRVDNVWLESGHGSTDRDEAIEQMVMLCNKWIDAIQKSGKRANIDAGNWDGRLVMRVIRGGRGGEVEVAYSIEK